MIERVWDIQQSRLAEHVFRVDFGVVDTRRRREKFIRKEIDRVSWYRHPKTTQQRRAHQSRDHVYVHRSSGAKVRCRSRRRNLVTAYDDLVRCVQRSWKTQRRTKYRVIKAA